MSRDLEFSGAVIRKVSISESGNMITVELRTAQDVARLASILQEQVILTIKPRQMTLPGISKE